MRNTIIGSSHRLCCRECGAEFEPWEEAYTWEFGQGRELVCRDCFDGLVGELSRREMAELIGSEVMTAEEYFAAQNSGEP